MDKKIIDIFEELAKLYSNDLHRSKSFKDSAKLVKENGYKNFLKIMGDTKRKTSVKIINDYIKNQDEFEDMEMNEIIDILRGEKEIKRKKDIKNTKIIELFSTVYGISTVTAKKLIDKGYKTIDDLIEADENDEYNFNDLQKNGLKYYYDYTKRITRDEMIKIDRKFQDIFEDYEFQIVGSYRRGKESSGDIDVLFISKYDINDLRKIIEKYIVASLTNKGRKVWRGLIRFKDISKTVHRIDFKLVNKRSWGTALLHATGSDDFNKKLREYSLSKYNISISEYSLKNKDTEEYLYFDTEAKVFNYLNLKYIEPKDRTEDAIFETLINEEYFNVIIDNSRIEFNLTIMKSYFSSFYEKFKNTYPDNKNCASIKGISSDNFFKFIKIIINEKKLSIKDDIDEIFYLYKLFTEKEISLESFIFNYFNRKEINSDLIDYFNLLKNDSKILGLFINNLTFDQLENNLDKLKYDVKTIGNNNYITSDKKIYFIPKDYKKYLTEKEIEFAYSISSSNLPDNDNMENIPNEKNYYKYSENVNIKNAFLSFKNDQQKMFIYNKKGKRYYFTPTEYTSENYPNIEERINQINKVGLEDDVIKIIILMLITNYIPINSNFELYSKVELASEEYELDLDFQINESIEKEVQWEKYINMHKL